MRSAEFIARSIRRSRLLFPLLTGLLLHIPATAQEAKTARLGFTMGSGSNQGRAAAYFAETLEKMSGGTLRIEPVAGAKLGPESQALASIEAGKQEMALVSTTALVTAAPAMALWDAPFLFDTEREADVVLDGPSGRKALSQLEPRGVIGLGYWEFGFRQITNSVRAVRNQANLRDLTLRVPEALAPTFTALGAKPANVPFPKLQEALRTKFIDGQEHPINVITDAKLFEVQSHLTLSNHAYAAWVLVVGKPWWDKLSNRERENVTAAAGASRDFERADSRAETARMLAGLKTAGMSIEILGAPERAQMRDTVGPVRELVASQAGQGLWQEVQAEITRIRQQK